MSAIVFMLTAHQAAALLSIRAGQGMPGVADRFQARIATVLVQRGLLDAEQLPYMLTPLGLAAAAVADKLAIRGGGNRPSATPAETPSAPTGVTP